MKTNQRAVRRHHYQRLKKNRRDYWRSPEEVELTKKELGRVANTPHPCSCSMGCGNPRRVTGERTAQERKVYQIRIR